VEKYASVWAQGQGEGFPGFIDSFVQTPFGTNTNWTTRETISHDRSTVIRQTEKGRVKIYRTSEASLTSNEYDETQLIADPAVASYPSQFVFSQDDRMVAGIYGQKIFIWDTETGKQLQTLTLPVAVWRVYGVEFTPDGSKLIVSASEDRPGEDPGFSVGIHRSIVLRVIDLQNGRTLLTNKIEQKFRKSGCNIGLPFEVTADSTQVITFTPNCKLGIYDINTGELLREFGTSISDANIDLAISPDGQLLAMTYKDRLELWDLSTGSLIKRYTNPEYQVFPHFGDTEINYIYQVAFSPDGNLVGTRFGWNASQPAVITLWGVPE
jgi:WD40 repeat protein